MQRRQGTWVGLLAGFVMACGTAFPSFAQDAPEPEVTRHIPVDAKLPAYRAAGSLSGKFNIIGSGIMSGFLTPLAESFEKMYPDVDIGLQYPSSAVVLDGIMDGTITVGAMSRSMNEPEKISFARKYGRKIIEICVAQDALEILVHRSNPIQGITLDQLDAVYSPACLRGSPPAAIWGDLGIGGALENQAIQAYGGGAGWGTTLTFEGIVTLGAPSSPAVHVENIETGVPAAVAKDPGGLGYTCLGKRPDEVKSIPIAETVAGPFVPCTAETLQSGAYPLRRPLYLYIVPDENGRAPRLVREFLLYALSREGQSIVSGAGMVPLGVKQVELERKFISGKGFSSGASVPD